MKYSLINAHNSNPFYWSTIIDYLMLLCVNQHYILFYLQSQASDADGEDGDDEGEDVKPDVETVKLEKHSPVTPKDVSKSPVKSPQKSRRRATIKVEEDKKKESAPSPIKDTPTRLALTSRPRVALTRVTDSSDSEATSPASTGRSSSSVMRMKKPKQR